MAVDDLDLNLLRVLEAVLQEGHVTRAAARLHLSQPAVSHALRRLRKVMGDPLLVRRGREMVLTPEGRRLAVEVPAIMDRIRAQIAPDRADLANTNRRFSLGVPDVLAGVIGRLLVPRVAVAAPLASLEVRRLTPTTEAELLDGTLDAAVGISGSWTLPLRSVALATVTWRPVASADHPMVGRPLTLEDVSAAPHLDVDDRFVNEALTALLSARGLSRRAPVVVMSRPAMAEILPGTDLIGFLPDVQPLDGRLRWLDLEPPVLSSTYHLWWGQGTDDDPLGSWLRHELAVVGSVIAPQRPRSGRGAPGA